MITKISKIKNLGIFSNYSPITGLKDFKRFNLIYGWNGSGKTTVSKLFNALEKGEHPDYPTLEFEIQNDASTKFTQGYIFDQKVRVFNQDYIESNLQIRDGKAKAITLVLGSASKEILEETERAEIELVKKNADVQRRKAEIESKEKMRNKTFTEIAKTIYVAITGGATRTYRKDNAESDFAKLEEKTLLTDSQISALAITVKQLQKPVIDLLKGIDVEFIRGEEKAALLSAVTDFLKGANQCLLKRLNRLLWKD